MEWRDKAKLPQNILAFEYLTVIISMLYLQPQNSLHFNKVRSQPNLGKLYGRNNRKRQKMLLIT